MAIIYKSFDNDLIYNYCISAVDLDYLKMSVLAAVDTGDRRQADRLGRDQGHLLETDRIVALFDMNKFQRKMADNIRQGRRDKREMELQV